MMPILSLIFSALFILFGTVLIQAFSDSSEDKPQKPKAKETKTENASESPTRTNTSSRPPKKDFVEVTELTDVTYSSNLVKLRPGHINVVLLLTDATKNVLLRKFAKEVYSFSGTQTLHFSFLNVDKHGHWMPSVLHSAWEAAQEDDPSSDPDPTQPRPRDYTGSVLALNGHKKYFCVFWPVFTGDDDDPQGEEEEEGASIHSGGSSSERKSSVRSRGSSSSERKSSVHSQGSSSSERKSSVHSHGSSSSERKSSIRSRGSSSSERKSSVHSQGSSSSERKSRSRCRSRSRSSERYGTSGGGRSRGTSLELHHKLDRLGLWMERLMEGTLPRVRVSAWPGLTTPNSSASET